MRDLFEAYPTLRGARVILRKMVPVQLVRIAEIYHFEAHKEKASIGCRLSEAVWGQGIATEVIGLLRDYLIDEIGLRTITAHIMRVNLPSAKAAQPSRESSQ